MGTFEAAPSGSLARKSGRTVEIAMRQANKKGHNRLSSTQSQVNRLPNRDVQNIQQLAWGKVFSTLMEGLPTDYADCAKAAKTMGHCFPASWRRVFNRG